MIYLAADHRGFQSKEAIKKSLIEQGVEIEDIGALVYDAGDDYVDFAAAAAEKIAQNSSEHKGIFICGSGHGMDMVANKYRGVRAAVCWNMQVARQSREHDDANVLVLPADWLDEMTAQEIVAVWLGASFSGEDRHIRRLKKIEKIEARNFK
ncbi:MAG: RpiB/LacA/LacB family sugar-phosphate isomerase [Candidatus Sungiibacteriota bacterium]